VLACTCLAACGAGDELVVVAAPSPDAGPIPDAPGAPADATPCHELGPSDDVVQMFVDDAPPAALGGPLPDGLYHLVSDTVHTGTGGQVGPASFVSSLHLRCESLRCELTVHETGSDASPWQVYELRPTGTDLALDMTCPATNHIAASYTSDGWTVHVLEQWPLGPQTRERVFERD